MKITKDALPIFTRFAKLTPYQSPWRHAIWEIGQAEQEACLSLLFLEASFQVRILP